MVGNRLTNGMRWIRSNSGPKKHSPSVDQKKASASITVAFLNTLSTMSSRSTMGEDGMLWNDRYCVYTSNISGMWSGKTMKLSEEICVGIHCDDIGIVMRSEEFIKRFSRKKR